MRSQLMFQYFGVGVPGFGVLRVYLERTAAPDTSSYTGEPRSRRFRDSHGSMRFSPWPQDGYCHRRTGKRWSQLTVLYL